MSTPVTDLSPEEVAMVTAALGRAPRRPRSSRCPEIRHACRSCGSPLYQERACTLCADWEVQPAPFENRPTGPANQGGHGRAVGHPSREAA